MGLINRIIETFTSRPVDVPVEPLPISNENAGRTFQTFYVREKHKPNSRLTVYGEFEVTTNPMTFKTYVDAKRTVESLSNCEGKTLEVVLCNMSEIGAFDVKI